MVRRLTLIAGSGVLPQQVADAARARGDRLQVLDVVGRGDLAGDVVLQVPVSNAAALVAAVDRFETTDLVLAGGVHLTDADRAGLAEALGPTGRLARSMGDTAMALAVLFRFRLRGVRVLGAHQVVEGLLAPDGPIAGPALSADGFYLARRALGIARAIGRTELGQSVVCSGPRPVAAEDAGGTAALLHRVSLFRTNGLVGGEGRPLILAKARRPHQPRFADLPAIGPDTIRDAASAGISMIAVEAGESLVLDRGVLTREAERLGISVVGAKPNNV